MILFSDILCLKVIKLIQETPLFLDFIRKKRFRVSNTKLTYRQVNSLESNEVLDNTREGRGWREFSVKDLFYLKMIANARKYGITNDMLKLLKEHLYLKKDDTKLFGFEYDLYYGEYAILAVFLGVRVGWLLFEDGKSLFTDMEGLIMLSGKVQPEAKSYLYMNINEIVIEILGNSKLEKVVPEYPSLGSIIRGNNKSNLSKKELEILNLIRNKDYTKVTIMKKPGEKVILYGEAIEGKKDITVKEILSLLDTREFVDISIKKRDGKIAAYSLEDVYKI